MFIGGCSGIAFLLALAGWAFSDAGFSAVLVWGGATFAAWIVWHIPYIAVTRRGTVRDMERAMGRR
jgi:hypothetical protein